jgi:hypothetical protein
MSCKGQCCERLWTHFRRHIAFEFALFKICWYFILLGLIVLVCLHFSPCFHSLVRSLCLTFCLSSPQYAHNVMHNLAYVLHVQAAMLHDIGFAAFPDLSNSSIWLSVRHYFFSPFSHPIRSIAQNSSLSCECYCFQTGDNIVWVLLLAAVIAVALPVLVADWSGSTQLLLAHEHQRVTNASISKQPQQPSEEYLSSANEEVASSSSAAPALPAQAAPIASSRSIASASSLTIDIRPSDSLPGTVFPEAILDAEPEAEVPFQCSGCFRFATPAPPRFAVLMLSRFFACLTVGQLLRIGSFITTQLPGPAPWCQPGSNNYNPPSSAFQVFFRFDTATSCGDLIFSSHMMFCSLSVMCVMQYYRSIPAFVCMLILMLCDAFLLISGQRHYTVDVWVSMYTVPLIWTCSNVLFPDPSVKTLLAFFEKRGVLCAYAADMNEVELSAMSGTAPAE